MSACRYGGAAFMNVSLSDEMSDSLFFIFLIFFLFFIFIFFLGFIYFTSIARARMLCESFSTFRVQPDVG